MKLLVVALFVWQITTNTGEVDSQRGNLANGRF